MTIMGTLAQALPEEVGAELSGEPDLGLAVVACMDARMDVYRILGLDAGDAHVIRNAGGVVTDDVIRSLVISQRVLKTRVILLVHHTRCGMLKFPEAEFRAQLAQDTGMRPEWTADGFDDVEADLRESVRRIEANTFVLHKRWVLGLLFDVDTGKLRLVAGTAIHSA